ncbi:hypothetical protein CKA32_003061 [Geitlerinema sp. FC II]|nr:hypothetical protein CKA32_003061 [Geitlerinema sp. FC II]
MDKKTADGFDPRLYGRISFACVSNRTILGAHAIERIAPARSIATFSRLKLTPPDRTVLTRAHALERTSARYDVERSLLQIFDEFDRFALFFTRFFRNNP